MMMMQRRDDGENILWELRKGCHELKNKISSKIRYQRSVFSSLWESEMKNNASLSAKQNAAQQRNYSIRSTATHVNCGGVSPSNKGGSTKSSGGGGGGGFVGGELRNVTIEFKPDPSTITNLSWANDSNHIVMIREDYHPHEYRSRERSHHIIIYQTKPRAKIIKTIDLEHIEDKESHRNINCVAGCSYSPSGENICVAKLDGNIEIYSALEDDEEKKEEPEVPVLSLKDKDETYSVAYLDDNRILSGDYQLILWDLMKESALQRYGKDFDMITDIDINVQNESVCVTSDYRGACKIWDIRMETNNNNWCQRFRDENDKEINCVKFFPDGYSFICGCRDGKIRLYDLKSMQCLNVYDKYLDKQSNKEMTISGSITDCCFSKSGYFLFATYDMKSPCFVAFNTITGKEIYSHDEINKTRSLECVDVSNDGYHIATAGSTNQLHILG